MPDDPQDGGNENEPGGSLDSRVGNLETGQDSLKGQLEEVLGILKGGGGEGGGHEGELSGGNVAAEIRKQIDERDARRKADEEKQAGEGRLGALETRVAELAEKPPQPMPTRRGKIMGWH